MNFQVCGIPETSAPHTAAEGVAPWLVIDQVLDRRSRGLAAAVELQRRSGGEFYPDPDIKGALISAIRCRLRAALDSAMTPIDVRCPNQPSGAGVPNDRRTSTNIC